MKKNILVTLIISSLSVSANSSTGDVIHSTGVLAHQVLSQGELAKIKHYEIKKVVSIEKMKEQLKVASRKIKKVNIMSLDFVNKTTKPMDETLLNQKAKKTVTTLKSMEKLLSEEELWGKEVIADSNKYKYKQLVINELNTLSNTLKETRDMRYKVEELISFYSFHVAINTEITETTRKEQLQSLLTAKESEVRKIMEKKILADGFEHNIYYVTNDFIPQKDDLEVLRKIFKAASNIENTIIYITGRADPRGNKKYNDSLARKRAETLKDIAINLNIDPAIIQINSFTSTGNIKSNKELYFFERNSTILIKKTK